VVGVADAGGLGDQAVPRAVAGEPDLQSGAVPDAGEDVADGLRVQASRQDGPPPVVQRPEGESVGVGVQFLFPAVPGADRAEAGTGAVGHGDRARGDLGDADVDDQAAVVGVVGDVPDPEVGELAPSSGAARSPGSRRSRTAPGAWVNGARGAEVGVSLRA
jgi:hypothetical protein